MADRVANLLTKVVHGAFIALLAIAAFEMVRGVLRIEGIL